MRLSALALVGILAAAPMVEATVLRGLTADDLRSRAELIVEGKVTSIRAERTDGRIETVAVVKISRVHKGEADRRVEVRTLGGRYRDQQMVVPGAPRFAKGERVLLFLYGDDDSWRSVGMFQGVGQLDAEGTVARASDSGGASLLRPDTGSPAVDIAEQPVRNLVGRGGAR